MVANVTTPVEEMEVVAVPPAYKNPVEIPVVEAFALKFCFAPKLYTSDDVVAINNGDNLYESIAAGSILAKVHHDKHIEELVKNNPELSDKPITIFNDYIADEQKLSENPINILLINEYIYLGLYCESPWSIIA